jgi:hypothetical protein
MQDTKSKNTTRGQAACDQAFDQCYKLGLAHYTQKQAGLETVLAGENVFTSSRVYPYFEGYDQGYEAGEKRADELAQIANCDEVELGQIANQEEVE